MPKLDLEKITQPDSIPVFGQSETLDPVTDQITQQTSIVDQSIDKLDSHSAASETAKDDNNHVVGDAEVEVISTEQEVQ